MWPVTILHLSDVQFGEQHRFAGFHLPDPDAAYDTLLSRLCDDLGGFARKAGLRPDLLLLTGDLAERGMRKEFDDFRKFAEGLAAALELPRRRVAHASAPTTPGPTIGCARWLPSTTGRISPGSPRTRLLPMQ